MIINVSEASIKDQLDKDTIPGIYWAYVDIYMSPFLIVVPEDKELAAICINSPKSGSTSARLGTNWNRCDSGIKRLVPIISITLTAG